MKFRGTGKKAEDMRLNMTAMIDIVFQLLVFFILTFKVTAMETDFGIQMPLEGSGGAFDVMPELIQVTLKAGADRNIAGIEVDNQMDLQTFNGPDMFQQLTAYVERSLAANGDPTQAPETEVEFVIDPPLRYKWTVKGIESVSGRVLPDGSTKKLVEKIKFRN